MPRRNSPCRERLAPHSSVIKSSSSRSCLQNLGRTPRPMRGVHEAGVARGVAAEVLVLVLVLVSVSGLCLVIPLRTRRAQAAG